MLRLNLSVTFPMALMLAASAATVARGQDPPSLCKAFAGRFDVGTAIGTEQITGPEADVLRLVAQQFSVVTGENLMKWQNIHPEPSLYDFGAADAMVEFAEANGLKVVGHTLVWHSQCPDWVFEDESGAPISREALVERLREHIHTVVGRYKGRVQGWDVVNEAINDDGSWRDTKWRQIIGPDYLELAFRFAHEADPDTELYYNDFSMTHPGKRDRVVEMVNDFRRRDVPIDGIGMQGHWGLDYPAHDEIEAAFDAYSGLGVKLMITELDIQVLPQPGGQRGADVNDRARHSESLDPYPDGLPEEVQQRLADRYAAVFRQFVQHDDAITRVTLWGVHDGQTWHNNWPVPGRTAHSLLLDRTLAPKPAYHAVIEVSKE